MWKHLWAKSAQPYDYMELILCRDVYHCTPDALHRIPLETLARHLACMDVEAAVRKRLHG